MNIKTKEFNITETKFHYGHISIIKLLYYKSKKALISIIAYLIVIVIVYAMVSPQIFFFIAILFLLQLSFYLITLFVNTVKSRSKHNFQNINCEITDSYFSISYEDGSLLKLDFNHFIRVTKNSGYYLMTYSEYDSTNIAKTNFYRLPIRVFNSENDINEFEAALRNKKLMK